MVQAKAFGTLKYEEQSHGWALESGLLLGGWELYHCTPDVGRSAANYRENELTCQRGLMSRLRGVRIDVEIPEREDQVTSMNAVTESILQRVSSTFSPSHCAFVLIGKAVSLCGLRDTVNTADDVKEIEQRITMTIDKLYTHCAICFDKGFAPEAIYDLLQSTGGDAQKTRQMLSELQAPMVILLVLADPVQGGRLRLQNEQQRLSDSLAQSIYRDSFELRVLPDARMDNLGPTIARTRPTIIHFSGHGTKNGIFLSDATGNATMMDPIVLSDILALAGEMKLRGVVMNACFTATSLQANGPLATQVVVMEGSLSDDAAINFSQQFYAYLGDGLSFKKAFEWAKKTSNHTGTDRIKASLIESRRRHPDAAVNDN